MSMTILTNSPTSIKPSRFAEMLAEFGYDGKVHLFDMVIQGQDGRTWTSINYTAAGVCNELNWPETDVLCITMRDSAETVAELWANEQPADYELAAEFFDYQAASRVTRG